MKAIKYLDCPSVREYVLKSGTEAEFINEAEIFGELSTKLGCLTYIDCDFFNNNTDQILGQSKFMHFMLVNKDGNCFSLSCQEETATENLFVRSSFAEQAAVTYVHELNNHLAIICGRLYEFKKIHKSMEEGELADKFQSKLESMNEKVDKITEVSRLFTRKSILAILPNMGEAVYLSNLLNDVKRDYRKILEKAGNQIVNEIDESLHIGAEASIDVENIIIAICLKLASCSLKSEQGTTTTVSSEKNKNELNIAFVLQGQLHENLHEYFYHRSWINFLMLSNSKNHQIEFFEGENKIHLEFSIKLK